MFPWADGESLRDFWDKSTKQPPSAETVHAAICQLRGLADALDNLHNFKGRHTRSHKTEQGMHPEQPRVHVNDVQSEVGEYANNESIRHGDLKPENILRFLDKRNELGVLKIADMGLAKRHVVATRERGKPTSMRFGTIRYEAPETVTTVHGARSRLYDIWSMGCITLEFIIWILYGNEELKRFYDQLKDRTKQACQYFEIPEAGSRAQVHRVVLQWMDHMQAFDPEFSDESALRDLLRIVRTKLLVVPLPPNRESSFQPGRGLEQPGIGELVTNYRATASQFRDALDEILGKVGKANYLLTGKVRQNIPMPTPAPPSQDLLSPLSPVPPRIDIPSPRNLNPPLVQGITGLLSGSTVKTSFQDYRLPPLEGWEFPVDNPFAERVAAKIGPGALTPRSPTLARLCSRCNNLDFWAGGFSFEDTVSELQAHAPQCDLCRMLHDICQQNNTPVGRKVRFERNQSNIVMAESDPLPVLSIFRGHGKASPS